MTMPERMKLLSYGCAPDLVDFGQVKEDESNLIGIAGRHPVRDSSAAFGNEILEYTMKTLISGIEKEYKEIKTDRTEKISIG